MIFGDEHLIELDLKTFLLLEKFEGVSKARQTMGRKLVAKQSIEILNAIVKICWENVKIAIEEEEKNAKHEANAVENARNTFLLAN